MPTIGSGGEEVFVTIEIDDEEAQGYFDYVEGYVQDMTEPLTRAMLQIVLPGVEEQFFTQGGRSGGWEPVTEKWFRYKETHAKFLTTLMFNDSPPEKDGRESGLNHYATDPANIKVEAQDASFEIDYDIARYQQDGDYKGGTPRPIVVWTADDEEELDHIFMHWLEELRFVKRNVKKTPYHSYRYPASTPWSPTGPGPGRFRPNPF